ncbi:MAG: beta-hydroxyacyl-ACP dehydratase [Bdellovibrionales bacterium]|nr:beta-hydroxyacyl-ACP dehydratase [Bdellovibrionales bacterium]
MRWILVDKILECEPGKSVVATKSFAPSDDFFADHFPNFPVVPGVMQIEMIAHAGGRCITLAEPETHAMLGSVKSAKFIHTIGPGSLCTIRAEITLKRERYAMATGSVEVDGRRVSVAEIMFALVPRQHGRAVEQDAVMADWLQRQKAGIE